MLPTSTRDVMNSLEIKKSKGGAGDKTPVFMIKTGGVKKIFGLLGCVVFFAFIYIFSTSYQIKMIKRNAQGMSVEQAIENADALKRIVELESQVTSGFVSQISNSQEAKEMLVASDQSITAAFVESSAALHKQLEKSKLRVSEAFDKIWEDSIVKAQFRAAFTAPDSKNLKPDIIAASEPLVQKANDELEKIRKVFSKLEEKIKQSQASILEDHVAQESQHAEAALDKLEDFAETSKENAVRAAAAQENARHQIEKASPRVLDDLSGMLEKFFENLHAKKPEIEQEAEFMSKMSEYDVSTINDGTKFRLEKLQEGFDKGTLPLEQFTEAVLDLVSKDLLPAPAESDMSLKMFVDVILLQIKEGKDGVRQRNKKFYEKKINAMNDLEQLDEQLNKGEVQEQLAFRKIRAAISRHFVPAAWLYPELEGSPVAERQQGRGKNNRRRKNKKRFGKRDRNGKRRDLEAQESPEGAGAAAAAVTEERDEAAEKLEAEKVVEAAATATPEVAAKIEARDKEKRRQRREKRRARKQETQPVDQETGAWIRARRKEVEAGTVSKEVFAEEVMHKYTDGKIPLKLMNRITKSIGAPTTVEDFGEANKAVKEEAEARRKFRAEQKQMDPKAAEAEAARLRKSLPTHKKRDKKKHKPRRSSDQNPLRGQGQAPNQQAFPGRGQQQFQQQQQQPQGGQQQQQQFQQQQQQPQGGQQDRGQQFGGQQQQFGGQQPQAGQQMAGQQQPGTVKIPRGSAQRGARPQGGRPQPFSQQGANAFNANAGPNGNAYNQQAKTMKGGR